METKYTTTGDLEPQRRKATLSINGKQVESIDEYKVHMLRESSGFPLPDPPYIIEHRQRMEQLKHNRDNYIPPFHVWKEMNKKPPTLISRFNEFILELFTPFN